jgi:hypothetical protein
LSKAGKIPLRKVGTIRCVVIADLERLIRLQAGNAGMLATAVKAKAATSGTVEVDPLRQSDSAASVDRTEPSVSMAE